MKFLLKGLIFSHESLHASDNFDKLFQKVHDIFSAINYIWKNFLSFFVCSICYLVLLSFFGLWCSRYKISSTIPRSSCSAACKSIREGRNGCSKESSNTANECASPAAYCVRLTLLDLSFHLLELFLFDFVWIFIFFQFLLNVFVEMSLLFFEHICVWVKRQELVIEILPWCFQGKASQSHVTCELIEFLLLISCETRLFWLC